MKKCIIIGAGDFQPEQWRDWNRSELFLIAADGGLKYVRQMGMQPDVQIGDWDSCDKPEQSDSLMGCSRTVCLPTHKDDTDMLAAIRLGISKGLEEFHIFGAMGGTRIDHSVANIQCLLYLKQQNKKGYIYAGNQVITLLSQESMRFSKEMRGFFSAFAYSDAGCVVSLEGFEYELKHARLTMEYPLGVSNSFQGKESIVTVEEGILLIVYPLISEIHY